jgi:hypothetical protein
VAVMKNFSLIYTIGEKCKIYAYFREKSWKKCKKLYFMRNFAFFGLAIVVDSR